MPDNAGVNTWEQDDLLNRSLDGLKALDDRYPQDAIVWAREHRDEMIPRLIQAIEEESRQVQETGKRTGELAFFALLLLGEFRAEAALPTILRAVSLPPDCPEELFGDAIHYFLPEILDVLSVSTDAFDQLIANPEADIYVRSSAAHAYLHAVFSQRLTREAAIEKLRAHLDAAIQEQNAEFVTWLVVALSEYVPHVAIDDVRPAFESQLVNPGIITLKDFTEKVKKGRDHFAARLSQIAESRSQSILDRVARWHWTGDHEPSAVEPARETKLDSGASVKFSPRNLDLPDDPPSEPLPPPVATIRHTEARVGRNDPCPCGSGKKFKKCCGG